MEENSGIVCKVCGWFRANWKKVVGGMLVIAGMAVGADIVNRHEDCECEDAPAEEESAE